MREVTVNIEQNLYVIPCGTGYSCLGFENAYQKALSVARWANLPLPDKSLNGTIEGYNEYIRTMRGGEQYSIRTKTRCGADLTPELIGLEGRRVEVVDRNGDTRRFQVGKSMGWFPIHLEVFNRRSMGGSGTYGTPYKSVRVVR